MDALQEPAPVPPPDPGLGPPTGHALGDGLTLPRSLRPAALERPDLAAPLSLAAPQVEQLEQRAIGNGIGQQERHPISGGGAAVIRATGTVVPVLILTALRPHPSRGLLQDAAV